MTVSARSGLVITILAVVLSATGWVLLRPTLRPTPPGRSELNTQNRERGDLQEPAEVFTRTAAIARSGMRMAPMRKETTAVLRNAIMAATEGDTDLRRSNLEVLDRLGSIRWPSVVDLKRVHLKLRYVDEPRGWLLFEDDKRIFWLTQNFRLKPATRSTTEEAVLQIGHNQVSDIDNGNLKSDLNEFLAVLPEREHIDDKWTWDQRHGNVYTLRGPSLFLLNLAYAAADCQLENETKSLVAAFFKEAPGGLPDLQEVFVYERLDEAIDTLQSAWMPTIPSEQDWQDFLEACKDLRAAYPDSSYAEQLTSLIGPLERELAAPRPAFLKKNPTDFTDEETMGYLIYSLRDMVALQNSVPGSPSIFSPFDQVFTTADRLVEIGLPAVPFLIEAIRDPMPTRTQAAWRFPNDKISLQRRQDIAFACLRRITGCQFYHPRGNEMTFIQESPQVRSSVLTHVNAWWQKSKGGSQAHMIRTYLATVEQNAAINNPDARENHKDHLIDALMTLGKLDGVNSAIDELMNASVRVTSLETPTDLTVPFLRRMLRSGPNDQRARAATLLAEYAAYADDAVPELKKCLESDYQPLHAAAKETLRKILAGRTAE